MDHLLHQRPAHLPTPTPLAAILHLAALHWVAALWHLTRTIERQHMVHHSAVLWMAYQQLSTRFPKAVWMDVARFRTSSHHLCVETGRWRKPIPAPLNERTCDLCGADVVQDEQHVLLECASPCLHALREKYRCTVIESECGMKDLMQFERAKDLS